MTKKRTPLAAIVIAAVFGAGCGSSAPSETAATTPTPTKATTREKAVKFSECMRGHGVPDFPDPDAKGEYAYGVSVTPAVFTKAVHACKALKPPGALSSKRSHKEQSASLRFAACMRANGVRDFPDPVQGQPLINTYKIPSSNRPGGMTILNAASAKCKSALDKALTGR